MASGNELIALTSENSDSQVDGINYVIRSNNRSENNCPFKSKFYLTGISIL